MTVLERLMNQKMATNCKIPKARIMAYWRMVPMMVMTADNRAGSPKVQITKRTSATHGPQARMKRHTRAGQRFRRLIMSFLRGVLSRGKGGVANRPPGGTGSAFCPGVDTILLIVEPRFHLFRFLKVYPESSAGTR